MDTLKRDWDEAAIVVDQLAQTVLSSRYLRFEMLSLSLDENLENEDVFIKVRLKRLDTQKLIEVKGKGVGLVDALFEGFTNNFIPEYPSLESIEVRDFIVKAVFEDTPGRNSDAQAHAELSIKNSSGMIYRFRHRTPSVSRSCVRSSLDALTFFINAERAYLQLQLALKDAQNRSRSDLVQRYKQQLAVIVKATNYSDLS